MAEEIAEHRTSPSGADTSPDSSSDAESAEASHAVESQPQPEDHVDPADGDEQCTCDHGSLSPEADAIVELRESFLAAADNEIGHVSSGDHAQEPFLGFTVDSKLHSIVKSLWVMGLPTDFSCEGHPELCHPELYNSEFYAQIVFVRLMDGVKFMGLLADIFGTGTMFAPEGFQLTAMDGDLDELEDKGYTDEEFLLLAKTRGRAEVTFHPEYVEHIEAALSNLMTIEEFDARRSTLEVAEDLDEAYEILEVPAWIRNRAEKSCDCEHGH